MQYMKLQLGCLIIIFYIICVYIRERRLRLENSNVKVFTSLLVVGTMTVIADALTSYTVNNLDAVSPLLNRILHLLFLLGMDATIFLVFLYILSLTREFPQIRRNQMIVCLPFIINVLIVILNIPSLEYRQGVVTNYSMGVSAYTCFGMVGIYIILSYITIVKKWRYMERRKRWGIFTYMFLMSVISIFQMLHPEALVTSLGVTVIIVGMYINNENPQMAELKRTHDEMIMGFATLVENKDGSTGGHIKRTTKYVQLLTEELLNRGYYTNILTTDYMRNLRMAAPMHDIGKISIPDSILQKPGRLTEEEFNVMKQHTVRGGKIVRETFGNLGQEEYAEMAYQMAAFHHEKWNGKGYPKGLKGKEIPLCARIMAIADVFDAVSEKRCYRDAMSMEQSFDIIREGRGRDFEPLLVDIFLDSMDKVIEIHKSM